MEIIKKSLIVTGIACTLLWPLFSYAEATYTTQEAIAKALGWVQTNEGRCNGYYLEPAISTIENEEHPDTVQLVSNQFLFSFKGTSESQGNLIIRRYGQEITANRAFLYRDPVTGKTNAVDLLGNVTLREPNTLVIARQGRLVFKNKAPTLLDILYRTAIYSEVSRLQKKPATPEEIETQHPLYQLSAWGQASEYNQERPKVYTLDNASYSTCPPENSVWQLRASHIELNKETGRGEAYHARLLLHDVPIFYAPYVNFPIDSRRKTGFLWPRIGHSQNLGVFINVPFYWNMAPNYDMTITPSFMSIRGIQFTDLFRYLTATSEGRIKLAVLPNDMAFTAFQKSAATTNAFVNSTDTFMQAELRLLLNASTTRTSAIWENMTRFNEHWYSTIAYNFVSDDYYLRDLVSGINEVTENQLSRRADITFNSQHWNFVGRLQGYQTLHPLNQNGTSVFQNQFSRFPQLVLGGNYPDQWLGLEFAIANEVTRFDYRNTPGDNKKYPIGVRTNIQPSISRPLLFPYFSFTPRIQFAMTQYELGHTANNMPKSPNRALPIFDVNSALYFDRDANLFGQGFTQTLEPQIYYTYIPFRDQSQLPIFDTIPNQLTYDQLFNYNRFSGIDRIGDANQAALGLITRFIDQESGTEKIRAGLGEIYYFSNRLVTACTTPGCNDLPSDPDATRSQSPLSAFLKYNLNPAWSAEANTIWDPLAEKNKLTNQTFLLHYQPDSKRIINLGYTFARGIDTQFPNLKINPSYNNLSQIDLSSAWPLTRDWSGVVRWTQNLNRYNFQNLLFGLQYDACCWAVRLVAGKEFIGLAPNNTPQYNPQIFLQFALKGLGNFGSGDPTQYLMSSVSGYQTQFGQDF